MIKTLKTLAIATLITGVTVTASKAQTPPYAVHNVSLSWTLYSPDTSSTNSKNVITDTYAKTTFNTASLIKALGTALGTTFKAGSSLVLISELSPGTNLTDVTKVVSQTYSYTNVNTNATYTNTSEIVTITNVPPLTNFDGLTNGLTNIAGVTNQWFVISTNAPTTTLTALVTNSIVVATNATYYVSSGKTLTPITNMFMFTPMDFSSLLTSSFVKNNTNLTFTDAAQYYTNKVFKGTIKTNLDITGTILNQGGSFYVNAGSASMTSAGPEIGFEGAGTATAVTGTVGKGKAAMPWSTWNLTATGTGSGSVGGTYFAEFTNTVVTLGTNPPATSVTNMTIYYGLTNGTPVSVSGSVTHTFAKIVQ